MTTEAGIDAIYEAALAQMLAIIGGVRPDQMELPTPCADWDVRALLNHVVSGLGRFAAMASGQPAQFAAAGPEVGDDAASAYRDGIPELLAAFRDHPESSRRTRSIHLIECAVHAWDLAVATGQTDRLDPAIAEAALAQARENLTTLARTSSAMFGAEIGVAATAPAYERLAGFLGRLPAA